MDDRLQLLAARVSALPFALRCLVARGEEGRREAWDRSDELLADLELLLTEALAGPRDTLAWLDAAEEAIQLKARVYTLMRHHFQRTGVGESTVRGYVRAARADVSYSEGRLRQARCRAPVRRPVWRYA